MQSVGRCGRVYGMSVKGEMREEVTQVRAV